MGFEYLNIGIKVFSRDQRFDDGEVVVGDGPVDGEAVVVVFCCGEVGVCLGRVR